MSEGAWTHNPAGKHLDDETLSGYIDGALSAQEMAAARRHLAACPICGANLRTLQQTVLLLKELPQVAAPRSFIVREADVTPQRKPAGGLFVFLRTATAAVAILFAAVLAGDLILRQAVPSPFSAPSVGVVSESAPAAAPQTMLAAEPAPETPAPLAKIAAAPEETTPTPEVAATQFVEKALVAPATSEPIVVTVLPPAPAAEASPEPTQAPPLAVAPTRQAALGAPSPAPTDRGAQDSITSTLVSPPATLDAAATATIRAAMTAAPAGQGGGDASPTATPTMEPPTATPEPSPTPEPPTPTLEPTQPPATALAMAQKEQAPADTQPLPAPAEPPSRPAGRPNDWTQLFRIAEIALGVIVVALLALTVLSRQH